MPLHDTQCMGVQAEDQEVAAPVEAEVEAVAQEAVVADQGEVVAVALQVVVLQDLVQQEAVAEGAMVA